MKLLFLYISLLSLFLNVHGGIDCDFDEGFCSWSNVDDADHNWLRDKGSTHVLGTGPRGDHTQQYWIGDDDLTIAPGKGYYLYVMAMRMYKPKLKGDTAVLKSPPAQWYSNDGVMCLQFWYYMYGSDVGSLNVTYQGAGSDMKSLLWTKEGEQGDYWKRGLGEITGQQNETFHMFFEVTLAGGSLGDIAIDDVTLLESSCPVIIPRWLAPAIIFPLLIFVLSLCCVGICYSNKYLCFRLRNKPHSTNELRRPGNSDHIETIEVSTSANGWAGTTRSPQGGVSIVESAVSYNNTAFSIPTDCKTPTPPPAYETVVAGPCMDNHVRPLKTDHRHQNTDLEMGEDTRPTPGWNLPSNT